MEYKNTPTFCHSNEIDKNAATLSQKYIDYTFDSRRNVSTQDPDAECTNLRKYEIYIFSL